MRRRLQKQSPRNGGRRGGIPVATDSGPLAGSTAWLGDDRLFTPLGHEPGYDYPLLVWLPDASEASAPGRPFDLGGVMKRVSLRNFVAVQPVIGAGEASVIDIDEAIWRSVERVRDRIAIHAERIFLVGQGRGGQDAFRIACRQPGEFAGVVSLGGRFPLDEGLFAQLARVRRLPMLFCCQRSSVVEHAAHTDRTLRLFHAAGASLAMRIYPVGNDLSKPVLADVNRWIMDEVCGPPAAVHSLSAS